MRTIKRLCISIFAILATFVLSFAWIKMQVSVTNMSASLVGAGDNLQIGETAQSTLGSTFSVSQTFTLGCCKSTNGYTFFDESGNQSTQYGEVLVFVKADKKREAKAKVVCENADPSMRIAITYVVDNNTTIFTPDDFNISKSLDVNFTNLGANVTIRVWFDGDTATGPVTSTPFQVIFEAGENAI